MKSSLLSCILTYYSTGSSSSSSSSSGPAAGNDASTAAALRCPSLALACSNPVVRRTIEAHTAHGYELTSNLQVRLLKRVVVASNLLLVAQGEGDAGDCGEGQAPSDTGEVQSTPRPQGELRVVCGVEETLSLSITSEEALLVGFTHILWWLCRGEQRNDSPRRRRTVCSPHDASSDRGRRAKAVPRSGSGHTPLQAAEGGLSSIKSLASTATAGVALPAAPSEVVVRRVYELVVTLSSAPVMITTVPVATPHSGDEQGRLADDGAPAAATWSRTTHAGLVYAIEALLAHNRCQHQTLDQASSQLLTHHKRLKSEDATNEESCNAEEGGATSLSPRLQYGQPEVLISSLELSPLSVEGVADLLGLSPGCDARNAASLRWRQLQQLNQRASFRRRYRHAGRSTCERVVGGEMMDAAAAPLQGWPAAHTLAKLRLRCWGAALVDLDFLRPLHALTLLDVTSSNLRSLNVLQHCGFAPMLQNASFRDCGQLVDLSGLRFCTQLVSLCAAGCSVLHLDWVDQCATLEVLDLSRCRALRFTDATLAGLSTLRRLRTLDLSSTYVQDMTWLLGCVDLESLTINHCTLLSSLPAAMPSSLRRLRALSACSSGLRDVNWLEYVEAAPTGRGRLPATSDAPLRLPLTKLDLTECVMITDWRPLQRFWCWASSRTEDDEEERHRSPAAPLVPLKDCLHINSRSEERGRGDGGAAIDSLGVHCGRIPELDWLGWLTASSHPRGDSHCPGDCLTRLHLTSCGHLDLRPLRALTQLLVLSVDQSAMEEIEWIQPPVDPTLASTAPTTTAGLWQLEELFLSHCSRLGNRLHPIARLPRLRKLFLSNHTSLTNLDWLIAPASAGPAAAASLRKLFVVSAPKLRRVDAVGALPQLVQLHLVRTGLRSLDVFADPHCACAGTLEVLNVKFSKHLTDLSPIGHLPHLRLLDANDSGIRQLSSGNRRHCDECVAHTRQRNVRRPSLKRTQSAQPPHSEADVATGLPRTAGTSSSSRLLLLRELAVGIADRLVLPPVRLVDRWLVESTESPTLTAAALRRHAERDDFTRIHGIVAAASQPHSSSSASSGGSGSSTATGESGSPDDPATASRASGSPTASVAVGAAPPAPQQTLLSRARDWFRSAVGRAAAALGFSTPSYTSVAQCAALEVVNLGNCPALRDAAPLGQLSSLRALEISFTGINTLDWIVGCQRLEALTLYGCRRLPPLIASSAQDALSTAASTRPSPFAVLHQLPLLNCVNCRQFYPMGRGEGA